jgi:hypothetical protein
MYVAGQFNHKQRGLCLLYYVCLNTNTKHAKMSMAKENKCYTKEHKQIFQVSTQVQTTKSSVVSLHRKLRERNK